MKLSALYRSQKPVVFLFAALLVSCLGDSTSQSEDYDVASAAVQPIAIKPVDPEDPVDYSTLKAVMQEQGLSVSTVVLNRIQQYAEMAPSNNAEFQTHYDLIYPGQPTRGDYGSTKYFELLEDYDESYKQQIVDAVSSIVDFYC